MIAKPYLAAASLCLAVSLAAGPAAASDASALASDKACMVCHSIDAKLIGPSFKEIANKHKGQDDAAEYLAKQIRAGSQGVWGTMPMPPNPTIDEAQATSLATWIMEQSD